MKYKPRYSGPNRTGICVCGHSWEEHHCGFVQNIEYAKQTGETVVPEECEHYGCNQYGGLMPNEDGKWVKHCGYYKDQGEEDEKRRG